MNEGRWFKGIVGLSNLPLEKIATLPAYAKEQFLKHMTQEESDNLRAISNT